VAAIGVEASSTARVAPPAGLVHQGGGGPITFKCRLVVFRAFGLSTADPFNRIVYDLVK
jgi:hypothetical protein